MFCTCSLLPSEGEVPVARFLETHPDWTLDPIDPEALGGDAEWAVDGALRLRPDFWAEQGGMDGFYIARLRKKA